MIKNSKQSWEVGQTVKIGFLSLTVKAAIATPGDFKPDSYILVNAAGTQLYRFTPHSGVEKISPIEARELIADAWVQADKVAAAAVRRASESARAIAEINDIIFA